MNERRDMKQDSYVTSASLLARVSDDTQSQGGAVEASREVAPPDVVEQLRAERDDLRDTISAWFDTSQRAADELTPILMDALRGYLRTSRSGGMPRDLSDSVEAVLQDFCRLHVGRTVLPVLRGLAEASSVSDGSPEGVKTVGLDPKDDSAVTAGQTPHPSPVDYTEVVNLPDRFHQFAVTSTDYGRPFLLGCYETLDAALKAQGGKPDKWDIFVRYTSPAQVIEARTAEIERKDRIAKNLAEDNCALEEKIASRDARVAELEKERDEALECWRAAKRRSYDTHLRLADAEKALGWIVSNPGAHSANMVTVADNALQTLPTTGGDSQ